MKERILAFLKTHQWCIIVVMIILAFYQIKTTADDMVIEHQQEQIEKYQAQAREYKDAYWQMLDEKNKWREIAEELGR
ncbi:MAG: hypothetical protein SPL96_00220 [Bacteroidales bacterium]|nr:hypothetical protein [Bacteroidales bacterium]